MKSPISQSCYVAGCWRRYCSFRQRVRTPPCTNGGRPQTSVRTREKKASGRHGKMFPARLSSQELPTTVRSSMEEHKDGSRPVGGCRTAPGWAAILVVCLGLHTVTADAAGPRRHFDLEAGDASLMLNE